MTKTRRAPVKESVIQKAILEWLRTQSHWLDAWRVPLGPMLVGKGHSAPNPMKGFPDIMGVFSDGRMFAIEVKSETGRLRPEQKAWRDRLDVRGVVWIEARSLEDVLNYFNARFGS